MCITAPEHAAVLMQRNKHKRAGEPVIILHWAITIPTIVCYGWETCVSA